MVQLLDMLMARLTMKSKIKHKTQIGILATDYKPPETLLHIGDAITLTGMEGVYQVVKVIYKSKARRGNSQLATVGKPL